MEKAVVFGTGNYYKSKKNSIGRKYEIIGFIDSRIAPGEEDTTDGIVTVNPKDIGRFPHVSILLMSVKFYEMWYTLVRLGVDENRIIFGIAFEPLYDSFEQVFKANDYRMTSSKHQLLICNDENNYFITNESELNNCIRKIYMHTFPIINILKGLPLEPISRRFGREHGTPIDRYYIEDFLKDNSNSIHGDVAEFADDIYTKRYGKNITHSYILHVNGWGDNVIRADLVTGEGIQDNMVDCLICTQTIQFIYDLPSAIKNIYRLLKPGGCALITAHGISQISPYDYRNWGEYWRFTPKTINALFSQLGINQCVISYGNVKTAVAMLYGICVEDLSKEDFEYNDDQYPLLLGIVINKNEQM